MRVLVVARTRMATDRVCVGGIELDTGQSLRLLGSDGRNLSEEHQIRPGAVWDLTYANPPYGLEPPHVEDVIVSRGHKEQDVPDMKGAILQVWTPWECELDQIFDGHLDVTENGTAFLGPRSQLPAGSTGFWESRTEATIDSWQRYWFDGGQRIQRVRYKGMTAPIQTIPKGALIRFSLARWAEFPPGVGEQRCYLQLSEVYL